ncbi:alternate-type signal peptide domain-containing protein [Brevibacterium luteolum]|uniref:Alternate-type signal peptide domain-containing protein n=1 Tax=Brevibacterium luteolum TaxID=199591 RepID=A0A6G8KZQ5_9MICO|nr:alternate-type signal peptide domain-containing protein [Brevibacterium luteolum]QIN30282.1 alternate-type signal peptide domain-containing protein [Brevibacterium luteolum]
MTETPTQKKPNRRAVKAAAAGALGVALLAGLGTTFAKWFKEETIGGGDITAGHLNMNVADAKWTDVNNDVVIDPKTFLMVPGDVVAYNATVTPDLVGDNLEATLKVDTGDALTGDLGEIVEVETVFGDGATGDPGKMTVTPDMSGDPIKVSVTIEFPLNNPDTGERWGDAGEDGTVNLQEITVELEQNDKP